MIIKFIISEENKESLELESGEHIFPFRFVLPEKIPASFEGRPTCYIRYWVKGIIEKPWKMDKEIKVAFTVGATYDLNKESRAKACLIICNHFI